MTSQGIQWARLGRLDEQQIAKVDPITITRYRKVASLFALWCFSVSIYPEDSESWDMALVEYKNSVDISKANFETLVATLEFVFPRYRRQFLWAKSILKGWNVSHVTRHTVPMTRGPAALFACCMATMGFARLGIALLLQQNQGHRPGETLQLFPDHCILPPEVQHNIQPGARYIILNLGVRKGTKAKRPQSTILREDRAPKIFRLLLLLLSITPSGTPLFPYTVETFRKTLKIIEKKFGISFGYTPHSGRAGFASEAKAEGWSFVEIREQGRWLSDESLRIYIDCVSAANISQQLKSAGLEEAQVFCLRNLDAYFPLSLLTA